MLPSGAMVIDTPGMRELGLLQMISQVICMKKMSGIRKSPCGANNKRKVEELENEQIPKNRKIRSKMDI
jgi:hypothetical protein